MQVIQPRLQSWGELYPNQLDGLALWLDAIDQNSLLASDGSVIEDGEAVALWSDKSGNSAENCLVLNGVSGNYASISSADVPAAFGSLVAIEIEASLDLDSMTTGARIVGRSSSSGNRGFYLAISSSGLLQLLLSEDGTATTVATSDDPVTFVAFQKARIKSTWTASTGVVQFFESLDDGDNWSQLGLDESIAYAGIYNNSLVDITIGQAAGFGYIGCRIYDVIIRSSVGGTIILNPDFTTASKLATSFTESSANAATVTINTSGATGARISGARDRYQGTVANRPLYSVSERSVTTDGSNDYMKGLAFSQGQPITIYAAMQQVTWTSGDYLFDGNANDTLALIQTTSTPQLNISAGSSVAANTGLAVATKGVVSAIYNGASSSLRINRGTATTGNAGAGTANGLTIGSKADGSAAGNGKYYEILVYSGAHDTATRDRITQYLGRKWGIAV